MKLLLAAVFILLSACAGPPKKSSIPTDFVYWEKHQQQVKEIDQWNIQGRVAVNTENNGGHADLFWQQKDSQHYDLKLVAPMGAGTSYIQARPGSVMLTTSSGEQLIESTIEGLLARVEDFQFPVSGLRYWILGVPSPASDSRLLNWDEQGNLNLLEQDGWRVEMKNYKRVAHYNLPKKVFASRINDDEVEMRLVIRHWGIQ